jgi:hypothetical protein
MCLPGGVRDRDSRIAEERKKLLVEFIGTTVEGPESDKAGQ